MLFHNSLIALFTGSWRGPPTWEIQFWGRKGYGCRSATIFYFERNLIYGPIIPFWAITFLSDPGVPGPIYGSQLSLTDWASCANLTDVTLADEDTNSIRTDNANRAM